MRWKTVALAGAFAPAVAGCTIATNAARNAVNEPLTLCTQSAIEHDLRKHAKAAWQQVRSEYPRRAFTAEFRDGFLDGYVDYLDRGGNGTMPAVAPQKYTRHKKYFTEEGQCLVKDYFLGFKYGQEIAIATGKRQFLTVPVLLPQEPAGPPAFNVAPHSPPVHATPILLPGGTGVGSPVPVLPNPRPAPKSDAPPITKTDPGEPTPTDKLPVPKPSLPVPSAPVGTVPPGVNPPPVVEVPVTLPAPPAAPAPKLPPPPPDVPELPAGVPTPSVMDELPVVLPNHTMPPPVLPMHPDQPAK